MNIGIIGYGSMGGMLLDRFAAAAPGRLFVSTRTREKLAGIRGPVTVCASNAELAAQTDMIFLCVRPADIRTVLEEIRTALKEESLIVSLNGSISFEQLGRIVPHKMAKAIPGVTAEIGRSQTLVCFNGLAQPKDREALKGLLGLIGTVIELPESEMGMGAELVSCMPGFLASILDVLCRAAGEHTAIPSGRIVQMVLDTVCATGEMMIQRQMSFGDVVDRVATKGGITEEGTRVIYERFPETARELYRKTMEKRRLTAERAEALFSGSGEVRKDDDGIQVDGRK